jgi:hypothetical protein
MTKNWKPADLRWTRHLLAERRAFEEARIADNIAVAARWIPYQPGWAFINSSTRPTLIPYHLAIDEFETPDDRWLYSPTVKAKDYSVAGEGTGQVKALGSNYDVEDDPETFEPSDEPLKQNDIRAKWGKGLTLGLDAESDRAGEIADAVKAWAGMATPPPKAADPTVAALVKSYLANGGKVGDCDAYRTTPAKKIKLKSSSPYTSAWAGGTGIPREMRQKNKRRFGVRPQTGSKMWSNTA